MKQVQLPNSTRMTSQLGFGCAFSGTVTGQQAADLLDAAYDAGIRHFDVAPYYQNGQAETYLGSFLSSHPDATVATKYGLVPPAAQPLYIKAARAVLGPAVRAIRRKVTKPQKQFGARPLSAKASFRPDDVVKSLNQSLTFLKRPHVDLLLLHEAERPDVEHEGLLDRMRQLTSDKLIGAFGLAGEVDRVSGVYGEHRDFCDVVQFDWDATTDGQRFDNAFQILFRVFSRDFRGLREKFQQDKAFARDWSDDVQLDMSETKNVSALMLKSALITNPDGVTLITSGNVQNIRRNVEIAEDQSLEKHALLFKQKASQATIFQ